MTEKAQAVVLDFGNIAKQLVRGASVQDVRGAHVVASRARPSLWRAPKPMPPFLICGLQELGKAAKAFAALDPSITSTEQVGCAQGCDLDRRDTHPRCACTPHRRSSKWSSRWRRWTACTFTCPPVSPRCPHRPYTPDPPLHTREQDGRHGHGPRTARADARQDRCRPVGALTNSRRRIIVMYVQAYSRGVVFCTTIACCDK